MSRWIIPLAAVLLVAGGISMPEYYLESNGAAAAVADLDAELDGVAESGPFTLPAGAHVERDIAYGKDPRQRLDVYFPAKIGNVPVLVMVHGGGWTRGNKGLWRVVRNKVGHWVGKGWLLVSINYRMVPAAYPLTQAEDVAQALAFVQAHLESWGGDPARIVLMGHSSGAHLVALLTADPLISSHQGAAPWRATVSLDSAAMNVEQIMGRRHMELYDGVFRANKEYWREASPTLRLVGKPVAPLLAVCSSQRMDSCPQAQAFVMRAQSFGGHAEVLPVNLSHPEINNYLGTPGSYTDGVDAFLASVGFP